MSYTPKGRGGDGEQKEEKGGGGVEREGWGERGEVIKTPSLSSFPSPSLCREGKGGRWTGGGREEEEGRRQGRSRKERGVRSRKERGGEEREGRREKKERRGGMRGENPKP